MLSRGQVAVIDLVSIACHRHRFRLGCAHPHSELATSAQAGDCGVIFQGESISDYGVSMRNRLSV